MGHWVDFCLAPRLYFFWRGFDNCNLRAWRNILKKKPLFWKHWIFFRYKILSEIFFAFLSRKFRRCCDNCIPCVYTKFFEKIFVFEKSKKFSSSSRTLSETFLTFCRKSIGEIVKNAIYVCIVTFWWKMLFFNNFNQFFKHF